MKLKNKVIPDLEVTPLRSLNRINSILTILLIGCQLTRYTVSAETVSHVACGSVIKLANESKPKVRLHSHDLKYGAGSSQQSVTAAENQDTNSYW